LGITWKETDAQGAPESIGLKALNFQRTSGVDPESAWEKVGPEHILGAVGPEH
jgi:hypothetical protein